jgi:hypothetical protein
MSDICIFFLIHSALTLKIKFYIQSGTISEKTLEQDALFSLRFAAETSNR